MGLVALSQEFQDVIVEEEDNMKLLSIAILV